MMMMMCVCVCVCVYMCVCVCVCVCADAVKAQNALDKRWFGGKVISAQFFDEIKFQAKHYEWMNNNN